ncbi:nucleotide exchange factor GrpE [Buchnera aphidicola]|uniref:nucleotide exchange factor GrpE n=1 Tax=Buchnera aphidicola TaxID=9 RepID=UPI002237523E|nr:nucleotide exchange factor GrpE [Buchnera aphidicola]MCW5197669.1 nucleotide exchange factor GrpE [Buchnera aphidicola (Chaitophorus viminalis)]
MNLKKKNKNLENVKKNKISIIKLKLKKKKLKKKLLDIKNKNKFLLKNFNIRIYKKLESAYKYSLEKIIISILPILDSLEIACKSIQNFVEYREIYKKLLKNNNFFIDILLKNNVKIIKQNNVLFDPSVHQAMFLVNSKKIKENYVVEVLQKGYMLHDRLLRAAMVSVSKN